MTGFLTFLTFLTNLTVWPEYHGFPVRNVRFSDKSDCACGGKSNFLSLSFLGRVFVSRAQSDLSESPILIQRSSTASERAPA